MKKEIIKYYCDICGSEINKEELLSSKGKSLTQNFETIDGRTEDVAFKTWGLKTIFSRKYFIGNILWGKCEVIDICNNCQSEIEAFLNKLKK